VIDDRFVLIGAQRSGTSYLYQVLDEHPEIAMAKPKFPEPKFFLDDSLYALGKDYYEREYFRGTGTAHIYGEKSTSYYEYEICARRMRECYPAMKILMVLRDPVDRALSNYFFSFRYGLEKRSPVEVFVDEIPSAGTCQNISTDPFNYLGRGEYLTFLKVYEKYFPRDQMMILLFEELASNLKAITSLYSYLGASSSFVPESLQSKINFQNISYETVDKRVIKEISRYFVPYNMELEKYLGRKLDHWKKPA